MKKIVIFIINFLLIICLSISCALIISSKTILSKDYIMASLDRSNFYNELDKSIQNDIDNYLAQAGIPNGALQNLYSIEDLKNSVSNTLDAVYYNKGMELNNVNIIENINFILSNYKDNKNFETLKKQIESIYQKKVAISPKYINIAGQKLSKILPIVKKGTTGIIVATIILLVIVLILTHNLQEILSTLGIAIFTTGAINCIFKLIIGSRFNNIFLLNDAFSGAIIYIVNDITNIILTTGISMIVLGLLAMIIGTIFKKD